MPCAVVISLEVLRLFRLELTWQCSANCHIRRFNSPGAAATTIPRSTHSRGDPNSAFVVKLLPRSAPCTFDQQAERTSPVSQGSEVACSTARIDPPQHVFIGLRFSLLRLTCSFHSECHAVACVQRRIPAVTSRSSTLTGTHPARPSGDADTVEQESALALLSCVALRMLTKSAGLSKSVDPVFCSCQCNMQ